MRKIHPKYRTGIIISIIILFSITVLHVIVDDVLGLVKPHGYAPGIVALPSIITVIYFIYSEQKYCIENYDVVDCDLLENKILHELKKENDKVIVSYEPYHKKSHGLLEWDESGYRVERVVGTMSETNRLYQEDCIEDEDNIGTTGDDFLEKKIDGDD